MEDAPKKRLKNAELIKMLSSNGHELSKMLNKVELLQRCFANGLITEKEFQENAPERNTSVKCYLYTLVENKNARRKIDDYVQAFSLFWIRAHYLANFTIHYIAELPFDRVQGTKKDTFTRWAPPSLNTEHGSMIIFKKFFENQYPLILKQMFIPDRYPTKKTPLDMDLKHCLDKHVGDLSHLFPKGWQKIMMKSGWDHPCSHTSQMLRTSFANYVRLSVIRCSKIYVKMLQDGVENKLFSLLSKPFPKSKPEGINYDVFQHIAMLRGVLGVGEDAHLPRQAWKVTPELIDLHLFFARMGILKRPITPIAKLGRKHAYIDERVIKALLPELAKQCPMNDSGHPLMHAVGLSLEAFVHRQNTKRRDLKVLKGRKRRKVREKWKKRGLIRIPTNGVVRSALTDGVSVVLRVATKMKLQRIDIEKKDGINVPFKDQRETKRGKKRLLEDVGDDRIVKWRQDDSLPPIFIGVDGGRAKIYTATIDHGDRREIKSYTRSEHYFRLGNKRRRKKLRGDIERNQRLELALKELSVAGKSKNSLCTLQVQGQHFHPLHEEYIEGKDHAMDKMLAHRYQRSTLAKAANKLLDVSKSFSRRVIIGYGEPNFPSGGKGEQSVPVKGIVHAIKESIHRRTCSIKGGMEDPIVVLPIDEYRTTKVCCGCQGDTEHKMRKKDGSFKSSSRLRYCPRCDKNRDRDVQASRNIVELTKAKYYGTPRPDPFKRQRRAKVTFTTIDINNKSTFLGPKDIYTSSFSDELTNVRL